PQVAAVRNALGICNLDDVVLEGEGPAVECFRHDDVPQRLRTVRLELWAPGRQFLFHVALDGRYRGRRGDHLGLGKRRLDRRQAEVVVRIALADVNGRELFAAGLDGFGERLAIGKRKATIDQHGIACARNQYRGTEESMLASGKMFPGQIGICGHGVFTPRIAVATLAAATVLITVPSL